MKKLILLYFLPLLMVLPFASVAKTFNPYKDSILVANGVTVNVPSGFVMVKNPIRWGLKHRYYKSWGRRHLNPTHYLHNQDTSILITLEVFNLHTRATGPYDRLLKTGGFVDPNTYGMGAYLSNFRDSAIVRFDVNKLAESNADYGSLSVRDMGKDHPHVTLYYQQNRNFKDLLGKFSNNRMVSLHKRFQCSVKLTYFFRDTSEVLADNVIKQTKDIVVFEDRPKFVLPDIDQSFGTHYCRISKRLKRDSLHTVWSKGVIYQDQFEFWSEDCAFEVGDIVLSVRFIHNRQWPRKRGFPGSRGLPAPVRDSLDRIGWERGNNFYKKLLVLSDGNPIPLSPDRLKPLNADEGFSFDFEYPRKDAYRFVYTHCKVMLIHKTNVGSFIMRYYYKSEDRDKVDVAIERTWGEIGFHNDRFFKKLGDDFYPF